MNRSVFLDASFWIAYRDERQEQHAQAATTLLRLFRERSFFVVTMPVVCEIHAHFSRSRIKKRVMLDDLFHNPIVTIADLTPADQDNALELLQTHYDKSYSLCDATSFVVMRRLGVTRAATFDNHFHQFGGFEIVA